MQVHLIRLDQYLLDQLHHQLHHHRHHHHQVLQVEEHQKCVLQNQEPFSVWRHDEYRTAYRHGPCWPVEVPNSQPVAVEEEEGEVVEVALPFLLINTVCLFFPVNGGADWR